jgi:hypothetical protein
MGMESKKFFGLNVSRAEAPVCTARGQRELEMIREENGNRAQELADRYLALRGGKTAN